MLDAHGLIATPRDVMTSCSTTVSGLYRLYLSDSLGDEKRTCSRDGGLKGPTPEKDVCRMNLVSFTSFSSMVFFAELDSTLSTDTAVPVRQ